MVEEFDLCIATTTGSRASLYHSVADVFRPGLGRKKEQLIEVIKEKVEIASKSKLAGKLKKLKGYYTLEMAPPSGNELTKIFADLALLKEFIRSGSFRFLTVKQAWLFFLVGLEIYLWFYLGETVGKMHIVGYKV